MIYDKIDNAGLYQFGTAAQKAFDFLRSAAPDAADGTYEIIGRDVYAMVQSYDTAAAPSPILEAHRKFIDIQYTLAGAEFISTAPIQADSPISGPYDSSRDAAFYKTPPITTNLAMLPGMFVLLFPTDGHFAKLALGNPGRIKKIVVKLRADLF